jgi:hypothetical protein
MPTSWISVLSTAEVMEFAVKCEVSCEGTLEEVRERLRQKWWLEIQGHLPAQLQKPTKVKGEPLTSVQQMATMGANSAAGLTMPSVESESASVVK